MKFLGQLRWGFYILMLVVSSLPLAGCETAGNGHYWRHKEWHDGDHGQWHDNGEKQDHR